MFSNIGGKIKTLAKVLCWIGIVASVIGGITFDFIYISTTKMDGLNFVIGIVAGLLIAMLGALISWVGSFVLYGFGQLVDNSDTLVQTSNKQ